MFLVGDRSIEPISRNAKAEPLLSRISLLTHDRII